MHPGLRVIRCGDWSYGDQDGGPNHVGTLYKPEKICSEALPKNMVFIAWDTGVVANYWVEVGDNAAAKASDLRVFDNSQTGTRHVFVTCDVCGHSGVIGMRWHCTQCHDFDLCTMCYMTDKHDLAHVFVRFDTPVSIGVEVPPREQSTKSDVQGIFVGAQVVRGIDWTWGNQDGGAGLKGTVIDISGRDNAWKSVLDVQWECGGSNRYRLGLEGKAEVQAVQTVSAGQFYCDHLPKLSQYAPSPCNLEVGDRVRIIDDVAELKRLQGDDDWDVGCMEYVGKIGSVVSLRKDSDVCVYFSISKKMANFNYKALTKVPKLKTGDKVEVIQSMDQAKQLQADHGGWVESMEATLGKRGKVIRVFDTGDVRVDVHGAGTWTFNPDCCTLAAGDAEDSSSEDDDDDNDSDDTTGVQVPVEAMTEQVIRRLMGRGNGGGSGGSASAGKSEMKVFDPENLVHQAERGDILIIRQLVQDHPNKVNQAVDGRLPLHIAAAKGHTEVVDVLLKAGADINAVDDDGDSALHYAVYGDRADVMEFLIRSGADINKVNHKHHTALQIAVVKPSQRCAMALLNMDSCNVNLQDDDGDTVLHDAVLRKNHDIVELLVKCPRFDFTLRNKKSFTVLHQATFKGNIRAVRQLLECDAVQALIDSGTSDGHTALHIAAINGFREVAQILIEIGKAKLNQVNKHHHTPLMLAMSEGRTAIIELLITKGADVTVADINGVTALHMALSEHTTVDLSSLPKLRNTSPKELEQAPAIAKICLDLPSSLAADRPWVGIACYLMEHGADIDYLDCRGNTPISHVKNPIIVELLHKHASLARATECMMCADADAVVTFRPCGHRIVCAECSVRMKKCFLCHEPIEIKVNQQALEGAGAPEAMSTRPATLHAAESFSKLNPSSLQLQGISQFSSVDPPIVAASASLLSPVSSASSSAKNRLSSVSNSGCGGGSNQERDVAAAEQPRWSSAAALGSAVSRTAAQRQFQGPVKKSSPSSPSNSATKKKPSDDCCMS